MASFLEKAWLNSFYTSTTPHDCVIKSKCERRCACLGCRKVIRPKPDLPDRLLAMTIHVMFASQPSDCDFLRGVCLHRSEMGMIYMRH